MGMKENLLALLEENKGAYFSGEELARRLCVSRTAVWKGINSLRKEGYEIHAVQNRGYSLAADTDRLSAAGIRKYLSPECKSLEVEVMNTVDSTNGWVRRQAEEGAAEGYVAVAAGQTKGRGRVGRSFFSPSDTGVYMSILLRPLRYPPKEAVKITTMAAVAVCRAIEEVSGRQAQIKWVNDIFVDGKKVSGILTEASVGLEEGVLDYGVLGIGLNAYLPPDGFPGELGETAGAVFGERQSDGKNRLAAGILNHFMEIYRKRDEADYAAEYRQRSMVLGREIRVMFPDHPRKALALDVDRDCRLVVQYEDGEIESLSSGEISVRI